MTCRSPRCRSDRQRSGLFGCGNVLSVALSFRLRRLSVAAGRSTRSGRPLRRFRLRPTADNRGGTGASTYAGTYASQRMTRRVPGPAAAPPPYRPARRSGFRRKAHNPATRAAGTGSADPSADPGPGASFRGSAGSSRTAGQVVAPLRKTEDDLCPVRRARDGPPRRARDGPRNAAPVWAGSTGSVGTDSVMDLSTSSRRRPTAVWPAPAASGRHVDGSGRPRDLPAAGSVRVSCGWARLDRLITALPPSPSMHTECAALTSIWSVIFILSNRSHLLLRLESPRTDRTDSRL